MSIRFLAADSAADEKNTDVPSYKLTYNPDTYHFLHVSNL